MYSLDKISTIADCDVLLTWAEKEKSDLLHKQYMIDRLTDNYSHTSVEIEAILQGVIAEIEANTIVANALPDGVTKKDLLKRTSLLQYKKLQLEDRKERYGSVALLEKELDLDRINNELAAVDGFIAGVTAHKAML
ncbi:MULTISPECIES: hypothetical protein [Flavobacterium]|uniref:hypothetical protein n=1 Tax=Flavobacterium TaxID=237 RepID=UPI001FCA77DD|nr:MULTISPECIES: hypothetical protein [Flavobacterium]UOK42817.1 hypothetical protein LZF87_01505 [Flavobacterium enshiense]